MSVPASANRNLINRLALPWPVWVAAAAFVGLLMVYPPFRVVSKAARTTAVSDGAFEPKSFAENFWSETLLPATTEAADAAVVLTALKRDTAEALKTHAHRVGLGNASYLFIRGTGRVIEVERNRVSLDVDGAVIGLRTGPVFGNTIRDGSGLIEVNDVPGLTEFNALSAELNRLVEERVQPALKSLAVGATVRFAGCAEAPETLPASGPLFTLIPVQAEVSP